MAETFQDDTREKEMRNLFNLAEVPGRSETDAILELENFGKIEFELKSTSDPRGSVTTVRDFGPDHIEKWKNKHWLIAFYQRGALTPSHYLYGSPRMMRDWIKEKWDYIRPDFISADIAAERISAQDLFRVLGQKNHYTYEDARSLHKRQYSAQEYREKMDLPNGYSQNQMLEIFRDRVRYLVKRGSTLNNPHIPGSYFANWDTKINSDHANRLKTLVKSELSV